MKKVDMTDYLLRAVAVTTLLGLSWVFAIPLTTFIKDDETKKIFSWLFSLTNALQVLTYNYSPHLI